MFNIQKAVSRLNYAPKLKEIKVTDIKKGVGIFTPQADKAVSFAALKENLKKAGYTLASAEITVAGNLVKENNKSFLVASGSGQRFALEGTNVEQMISTLPADKKLEMTGGWQTTGEGSNSREVITLRAAKIATVSAAKATFPVVDRTQARFLQANFETAEVNTFDAFGEALPVLPEPKPAPIRVTSPGLTVYKGGAVTPRVYFSKQHLGNLEVNRQAVDLSVSYTPSPRVQLEIEIPFSRTSYDNGSDSGAGAGLGNITLWSKYRFFRKVKTYGDRQAAVRFGLELPTGKKNGPTQTQLNAPAFVRQQLTPISGGFAPHFDVAFSQAGGRFIFGGNVEAIVRSERDGFRMGHELRVNTDSEYVLLPRKYVEPGHELFLIVETTFVHRALGRVAGQSADGSNSTEYYIAPGLQYAAAPQFVIEGSIQLPLIRNTGPLVLRNDRNLLLGVRYLF